jgi:hypothetical protein
MYPPVIGAVPSFFFWNVHADKVLQQRSLEGRLIRSLLHLVLRKGPDFSSWGLASLQHTYIAIRAMKTPHFPLDSSSLLIHLSELCRPPSEVPGRVRKRPRECHFVDKMSQKHSLVQTCISSPPYNACKHFFDKRGTATLNI